MNWKNFLHSVKIVYGAMAISVLIFAIIVYVLLKPTEEPPTPKVLIFVLPLLIAIGLLCAEVLPARKFQGAHGKDLRTKLATYKTGSVLQAMSLEIPALIAIITALVLQNRYWLWFSVFPIFWMLYRFPSENNVIKSLDLNYDEIQKLEK